MKESEGNSPKFPPHLAELDTACSVCGGAGEMCTRCERPPVLCSCGELQALLFCGLCQGTGRADSVTWIEGCDEFPL